jgi:[ribosomal protein S5]-alanine N-acetyltransferase
MTTLRYNSDIRCMILDLTIFPVLTTERLRLRRLSANDATEIMRLRSDERVNEFIDRPKSTTLDDARAFIKKIETAIEKNESAYWAITLKDEDKLIGTVCFWNLDTSRDMAELGYELHPDSQGKGIMQEAIPEVLKYGFERMLLRTITALPMPGNTRSIRVLEKNNFQVDNDNEYVSKEDAGGLVVYFRDESPP